MENQPPYPGLAIGAWIVLSIGAAVFARRLVVAFLLGLLFSAAFVGYCMYYQGLAEGAGIPQALAGALPVVGVFYLIRWIRGGLRRQKNVETIAPNLRQNSPPLPFAVQAGSRRQLGSRTLSDLGV